jgi:hypothetical protein
MKLSEIASFIKSANAGASQLTFDIGFDDASLYRRVSASGSLSPAAVARLYGIEPGDVRIYPYAPSTTIKITIPRPVISGGIDERDFDGVQQFAPLLDLEVELPGA